MMFMVTWSFQTKLKNQLEHKVEINVNCYLNLHNVNILKETIFQSSKDQLSLISKWWKESSLSYLSQGLTNFECLVLKHHMLNQIYATCLSLYNLTTSVRKSIQCTTDYRRTAWPSFWTKRGSVGWKRATAKRIFFLNFGLEKGRRT